MFEFVKANSATDPTIDEIRFIKDQYMKNQTQETLYSIEITPSDKVHHFTIRGVIHTLIRSLKMIGSPIELEVDFKEKTKVKVVGNIDEAMSSFKENNEVMDLFSEGLFLAIEDHKGMQAILKNCKDFYAEKNKQYKPPVSQDLQESQRGSSDELASKKSLENEEKSGGVALQGSSKPVKEDEIIEQPVKSDTRNSSVSSSTDAFFKRGSASTSSTSSNTPNEESPKLSGLGNK